MPEARDGVPGRELPSGARLAPLARLVPSRSVISWWPASCSSPAVAGRSASKLPPPIPAKEGWTQEGTASWYGRPYHGRRTSNGERYDMNRISAAHKRLPFDTWVRVTNLKNKKTVDVRINDRGPFVKGRIIDLSRAAAKKIDMIGPGTARVRIKVVAMPGTRYRPGRRNRRDEVSAEASAPVSPPSPPAQPPEPNQPPEGFPTPELRRDPYNEELESEGDPCAVTSYFGVQVGAFAVIENAELLRDKMTERHSDNVTSRVVESRLARGYSLPSGCRPLRRSFGGAATEAAVARRRRKRIRQRVRGTAAARLPIMSNYRSFLGSEHLLPSRILLIPDHSQWTDRPFPSDPPRPANYS